jgi:[NiFe] hydrogenase diaphorase moiety small subunit
VKINDRHVASCITPATDGAVIENNCDATRKERQTLLKLLFVEGNHVCPACEKSGACQLQAVAYYCGMLAPEFTHFYPKRSIDASHPDYIIDFNRCIMCDLCVRASHIKDDKDIFSISGRGINAHLIINSPSGKLGDTNFSKEDKAAHVCPVGAIMPKHKGYSVPIGERLYDRKPVSMVGDVTDNLDD